MRGVYRSKVLPPIEAECLKHGATILQASFSVVPLSQEAILEQEPLEALILLLSEAQPDGQYSAAAALTNLATGAASTAESILEHKPEVPLKAMLNVKSW